MATFKVGQRVRKVSSARSASRDPVRVPFGAEGTIRGCLKSGQYAVRYDHYTSSHPSGLYGEYDYMLVPLTDPKAEEFIERIKRMEREPNTLKDPAPNWDHA